MTKKEINYPCDNCGKIAKYYLSNRTQSYLYEITKKGSVEVNQFGSDDWSSYEYFCEDCAEKEGIK